MDSALKTQDWENDMVDLFSQWAIWNKQARFIRRRYNKIKTSEKEKNSLMLPRELKTEEPTFKTW